MDPSDEHPQEDRGGRRDRGSTPEDVVSPGSGAPGPGQLIAIGQSAHLVVCEGELIGRRFSVAPGVVVGRSVEADIQLPDIGASRQHARFVSIDGVLGVEDLGSHNGLFVNRARTLRTLLRVGDVLRIGDTPLAVHVPSAKPRSGKPIVDALDDAAAIVPAAELVHPTLAEVSTDEFLNALGILGEQDTQEASPDVLRRMIVRTRHFAVVYGICREIGATAHLDTLLARAIEHMHKVTGADRGHIVLFDSESVEPSMVVSVGGDGPYVAKPDELGTTVIGWVVENRSAVLTSDARSDGRFADGESMCARADGSILCVPMIRGGDVIGVVKLVRKAGEARFSRDDLRLVAVITPILAVAVHNARLAAQQRQTIADIQQAHRDLVRAQEALVAREKMAVVGHFASGMAHEIRNALVPLSLLEDLEEVLPQGSASRDDVALMREASERLRVLVEEIRTFGRDERAPLRLGLHDLGVTIERAIAVMRCDPTVRRHVLRVDGAAVPPFPYDEVRVKQVLINLVHGTAQSMDGPGTITLRYGLDPGAEGHVSIAVHDPRRVLSADELTGLGQPLLDASDGEGRGLGFDLARRIVERHGGSISCRSAAGEGTTMTVRLPRRPAAAP